MKRIIALLLSCCLFFTGCSFQGFQEKGPTAEQLLASVPKLNKDEYNRFMFDLTVFAGNKEGDGKECSISTALETWGDIAHMYGTHVYIPTSGYEADTENWSDFAQNICWKNMGLGWSSDETTNNKAMNYLMMALNSRTEGVIANISEDVCTVSWVFPTDVEYLFGPIIGHYTTNTDLNGYGRTTAVFDPKTHEFRYFTVIVSANNEELASALLDMVLYWDIRNDSDKALKIPDEVSKEAYFSTTGVDSDGKYDSVVNPIAETLIELYGGTADVRHDGNNAHLFWTVKQEDGLSATAVYSKETDPLSRFAENYDFFVSLYGKPTEETENGAYFWNQETGELVYMAHGVDWYAEITITGTPENTQGELRKPLITYKSRLGI